MAAVTRPPIVSYSSSSKSAPKRSLKSPIGVSASTAYCPSACAAISVDAQEQARAEGRERGRRDALAEPEQLDPEQLDPEPGPRLAEASGRELLRAIGSRVARRVRPR